ncbi:methyltransferase domain-containing protein [Methylobacterium sp. CM6257]
MSSQVIDEARIGLLTSFIRRRPRLKQAIRPILERCGYGTTDWVREVMYAECFDFISKLGAQNLDALEISAGNQWNDKFRFKSFTGTEYPEFDICTDTLDEKFDLIIADQVFEHIPFPLRATKNVYSMLRPGGHFIIATPFLLRVHNIPIDCSRWTETGLSYLLQEGGFSKDDIQTHSWGNRACVVANFTGWKKRGFFGSMRNEPNFPVMVWAYAQRTS